MPRFAVSVTERDPGPAHPERGQKCKCKCFAPTGPVGFEASVVERDLGPERSHGAQKCKCGSSAPLPGPWSRVAAGPRSTELSPLGDER